MSPSLPVDLGAPAQHVDARVGDEIVVHGAARLSDGSTIDAASTTDAPQGVDSAGLVDFEAGGFHVVSRDPKTHEVHAVATGGADRCAAFGVASPCLPLRLVPLARSRLLTVAQFRASIVEASMSIDVPIHAVPPSPIVRGAISLLSIVVPLTALAAFLAVIVVWARRRVRSPLGRLMALADRVEAKAARSRGPLVAPLRPALREARRALRSGRIEAHSPAAGRIAATLADLERRLDVSTETKRVEEEAAVARAIVEEIEIATRAAEEAARI
jgi:hypothetical protein